ncbi:hypothetical protein B0T21DRAFT_380925 [Apiosordaria backusii]|uniref:Uncharacterized protein n=1 Tax=Apiosordaria backusii TaxID=314023 RepID=A0AA40K3R1_9PEZI|nr:hypothetical protein B0T21DRAFT_380925 [Apiosordaria backusii]
MGSSRYSLDSTTTFAASPTSPSTAHAIPKLHGEGLGLLHDWEKSPRSLTTTQEWRDDTTQQHEKPARRSRLLAVTLYLLAFFIILICACATWGIVAYSQSQAATECVSHSSSGTWTAVHLASDINGLVPDFPLRPQTFHPDPSDHSSPSPNTTSSPEWFSAFPLGNGFITTPPDFNPSLKLRLPPPMQYKNQQVYSVAVFHQLHCLQMIMTSYNTLVEGNINKRDGHHQHINHCFGYLRQSLMCCGDTALEGQNPDSEGTKVETDGMGVVHMCKDYEGIREWVEGRRVSDERGGLR